MKPIPKEKRAELEHVFGTQAEMLRRAAALTEALRSDVSDDLATDEQVARWALLLTRTLINSQALLASLEVYAENAQDADPRRALGRG